MKTDKEYPATHSMSTAWYCVDEDGNVGIFDIDDNGPVPTEGCHEEWNVDDVFWDLFSQKGEDAFKDLRLDLEQINSLLGPIKDPDKWKEWEHGDWYNRHWYNVVVRIDMSKLDIFKKACALDNLYDPVCLSRKDGLFYINLAFNRKGVELLEENHVIISKQRAPHYSNYREDEQGRMIQEAENNRFPIFIYYQDYNPNYEPAVRISNPAHPFRKEQLPKEIQDKITSLPVKFKDREKIQLAEFLPVDIQCTMEYVYDGQIWCELATSDDSLMYYNEKTRAIINKETMDKLIAEGKAEDYEWDKHRDLRK